MADRELTRESPDSNEFAFTVRTVEIVLDRERRFLFWRWPRRTRRHLTLYPLPLRELASLEVLMTELGKRLAPEPYLHAICALLVGRVAYELPEPALRAIEAAYREVNRLVPKAEPAPAPAPPSSSPSTTSSDASSSGPSASSESGSSA